MFTWVHVKKGELDVLIVFKLSTLILNQITNTLISSFNTETRSKLIMTEHTGVYEKWQEIDNSEYINDKLRELYRI